MLRVRIISLVCGLILIAASLPSFAQKRPRWKAYDSIYYENLFLPNFSNLLMPKGYMEVILNNSLLTSNQAWVSDSSPKVDLAERLSYNYTTLIANMGTANDYRFNAGVELHYGIGYIDSDPNSSALNIYKSPGPGFVQRTRSFTSVGPRIKWRPFKKNLHFVYISTLQLPLSDPVKTSLLSAGTVQWGNQFLYSFTVGKRLAFFAQEDFYITFRKNSDTHNIYYNAITGYGYILVTNHFFPFVSVGYLAGYGSDGTNFKTQYQALPIGGGIQYQFSLRFTMNVSYNQYAWGRNYSDWRTISLGLRGVF